jgi:hypothetical protein
MLFCENPEDNALRPTMTGGLEHLPGEGAEQRIYFDRAGYPSRT